MVATTITTMDAAAVTTVALPFFLDLVLDLVLDLALDLTSLFFIAPSFFIIIIIDIAFTATDVPSAGLGARVEPSSFAAITIAVVTFRVVAFFGVSPASASSFIRQDLVGNSISYSSFFVFSLLDYYGKIYCVAFICIFKWVVLYTSCEGSSSTRSIAALTNIA